LLIAALRDWFRGPMRITGGIANADPVVGAALRMLHNSRPNRGRSPAGAAVGVRAPPWPRRFNDLVGEEPADGPRRKWRWPWR
jgi:hypothetical protein